MEATAGDAQPSGDAPVRPLRFLLLTQYYRPEVGAPQVRLQAMVRELVRQGHDVDVVTAMPNYPTGRIFPGYRRRVVMTESLDGATIRRIWAYAATGTGLKRMIGYATFAAFSLPRMFSVRRPDVVIVESPPLLTAIPAMIHRLVRRTPFVLFAADLWPDVAVDMGLIQPGPVLRVLQWLERLTYRRAWRISPVTETQIDTLVGDKHVPREKIAFLPNGVDPELFAPGEPSATARALISPHGERAILYAGTHGHAHGMEVLLDAAPLVRERHPDVVFVCVGGGSERARIIERTEREGIAGFRFLEPRPIEEIADLYRASWAGISTLRPSKSLEAARPSKVFPIMASGKPVIYSGNGEGAKLVESAGAGVTSPGGDHVALAAAIVDLLEDPRRAEQLGRQGRAYVIANLAWPALLRNWLRQLGSPGR